MGGEDGCGDAGARTGGKLLKGMEIKNLWKTSKIVTGLGGSAVIARRAEGGATNLAGSFDGPTRRLRSPACRLGRLTRHLGS